MFKRLRNKFLVLAITVTFFVLCAAFSVIYAVTYESIRRANVEKLGDSSLNPLFQGYSGLTGLPDAFKSSLSQFLIPSDYRPSFTLLLDEAGAFVTSYSLIDMSEADYMEAAEKAWQKQSGGVAIRVNGRLWQYAVSAKARYIISTAQGMIDTEGYTVSFLDVTESHQTLRELSITFVAVGAGTLFAVLAISLFFANRAVRPIEAAWEAQKQFIADASHELKTPLTIINSNYSALMLKPRETIESQAKWLNYIKDGAGRMDRLIGDLLCLARAEGAEKRCAAAPVNVGDIVRGEIRAMEVAASEKGLTVAPDMAADIVMHCEGEKIAQVVRILLDNAIKYAFEGSDIYIALKQERNHVIFYIRNCGPGIEKEHLGRIFDRFYRADASRAHDGGYGLGLSIAKAIVESMGGKITAASEAGKDATFTVIWTKK